MRPIPCLSQSLA